jgi:tRNA pseudouridine38-40 synthase
MHYRYFIIMQFNGRNYHGWQIQPNAPTIQAELNEKLGILLNTKVSTTGAGRTDTGVNAMYFVAHFDSPIDLGTQLEMLCSRLNQFLPDSIYIQKIISVGEKAHARFDAISRTYKYYISTQKEVFNTQLAWNLRCKLDMDIMNEGATILMEYDDFTSFSKLHSDIKTNRCNIMSAFWTKENNQFIFTITADRFLRNMVRAIVGTLVALGRNKINTDQLRQIIEAKDRGAAGESVPPNGLFLYGIQYPYEL